MVSPRDYKQISEYIGHTVEVEFKDGRMAEGILSFFNYQQQVIHISDYKLMRPEDSDEGYSKSEGPILIINTKEWKTVQVK